MNRHKNAIGPFILFIGLMAASPVSSACSCLAPQGSVEDQMRSGLAAYDSVFLGKAEDVTDHKEQDQGYPRQFQRTRFRIEKSWKLRDADGTDGVLETDTETTCCMCGMNVVEGKRYLIFANRTSGTYSLSICSPSRAAGQSAQHIEALDAITSQEGEP